MPSLFIETPCLESQQLSKHLGIPVFLKMETLQPSGSFKNRGIGHICSVYAEQGAELFISSSGGNAGLAVAYSGRLLKIPVKVVVPKTTSPIMIEKIKLEEAEVIVHGRDWDEADRHATTLLAEKGSYYISPFNHPLIWEGHSTMIQEIHGKGEFKPGAIIVAVGGGGLLCGVLEGLHQVGWEDVPVITVETEGAASFAVSVREGKVVTLEKIDTIATSLGARRVADAAFEWTKRHEIYSEVVTDHAAVEAALRFADDRRILVEPACGASLSLVYDRLTSLEQFHSILVIVCGGCGVTSDFFSSLKR